MGMLSRYDGKRVRITTTDGCVYSGRAESYPSGYALHVFGTAEETLKLGGTHFFRSAIVKLEDLSALPPRIPEGRSEEFDALFETLVEGPVWVADALPEDVPKDAPGQFFAVERYFRQPERLAALYRVFAEILLRLSCWDHMAVSFDGGGRWEMDPEPEAFVANVAALEPNAFLRAIFPARGAMAEIEPGDTCMSFFCPDEALRGRISALCAANGLFFRQPADPDAL